MKSLSRLPHVATALFVAWALAACVAEGQRDTGLAGDDAGDDAGDGDAPADANCSAAEYSGTDVCALEYPVCCPQFNDLPWGGVNTDSVDSSDFEYELVVTQLLEDGFVAKLYPEGLQGFPGTGPTLTVALPPGMAANVRLPEVGDSIISLGGTCYEPAGYVRVTTLSGELIYEGGAPLCSDSLDDFWPVPPRLSQRLVPSEPCIEFRPSPPFSDYCITRTDMEVVLHQPDGDSVVVAGEDREIEIDGLRYLVSSQGAFLFEYPPFGTGNVNTAGSAFIARLPDP